MAEKVHLILFACVISIGGGDSTCREFDV